jgi:hypothetical protein
LLLPLSYVIISVRVNLRAIIQTLLARHLLDDKMGRAPAFKIHGFAAVGLARIPGDEIELALATDDGVVRFHGHGLWMIRTLVFL